MKYTVKQLLEIQFEHSYFMHLFNGFEVKISKKTERDFLNYGLYFKSYSGGFRLLYDDVFAGSERSREEVLKTGLVLQFFAELKDKDFYSYTAGNYKNLRNSIFYFSNNQAPLKQTLQKAERVSEKDLYPYPLPLFKDDYFVKPFAKLVIRLKPDLPDSYIISFEAVSAYWRYILVNKNLKELKSPAILDEKSVVLFEDPVEIDLPLSKKALAIISKNPLQLTARPKAIFQLVENYTAGETKHRTVIRSLPGPDINTISSLPHLPGKASSNCSDIFIN